MSTRKNQRLLLCLTVLLAAAAAFSLSFRSPYSYQAQRTTAVPVIDGKIDPVWNDKPADTLSAITYGSEFRTSDKDLLGTLKTLWDDRALYVLVQVDDDRVFKPARSGDAYEWLNAWDTDNVELYFRTPPRDADTTKTEVAQLRFVYGVESISGNVNGIDTTRIAFRMVPTERGYVLEAAIPWQELRLNPGGDPVVHFDVLVYDNDKHGPNGLLTSRETTLGLSPHSQTAVEEPANYAELLLVH